jgi:large subunit ribosomal protein L25
MAEKVVVKAQSRSGRGKNDARRLRLEGMIPVSVYGGGKGNATVSVALSDLAAILRSESGQNTVFEIDIEGDGTHDVMFADRQIHPIKGRMIHADLVRVAKGQKFEMVVPIVLVGKPVGLSTEGATLTQLLRELKIFAEPSKAPEFIEVDVTSLGLNDSVLVGDLPASDFDVVATRDTLVATVTPSKRAEAQTEVAEVAETTESEKPSEG